MRQPSVESPVVLLALYSDEVTAVQVVLAAV